MQAEQTKTVLVVDDDVDVQEILQLVLREAGYDVVTASHGAQALRLLDDGLRPSVILLDLMMPVMSGWDFWDRVQASVHLRRLPIIILTATGLTQGAVGQAPVLPKPVSPNDLLTAIEQHALAA